MADIDIIQPHTLTHEKAIAAAQKVADRLADEYGLACAWDGGVLRFERAGVDGSSRRVGGAASAGAPRPAEAWPRASWRSRMNPLTTKSSRASPADCHSSWRNSDCQFSKVEARNCGQTSDHRNGSPCCSASSRTVMAWKTS